MSIVSAGGNGSSPILPFALPDKSAHIGKQVHKRPKQTTIIVSKRRANLNFTSTEQSNVLVFHAKRPITFIANKIAIAPGMH
jgi:apolipoprotein N-acyltransferase